MLALLLVKNLPGGSAFGTVVVVGMREDPPKEEAGGYLLTRGVFPLCHDVPACLRRGLKMRHDVPNQSFGASDATLCDDFVSLLVHD